MKYASVLIAVCCLLSTVSGSSGYAPYIKVVYED